MIRTLRPRHPLDLSCTLRPLRRGSADPTVQLDGGEVWRASRTPDGPGTTHLLQTDGEIVVTAWGPGAEWMLAHAPALIGLQDCPEGLRPRHPVVRDAHRRHPGLRLGATGAVTEALIGSILEQRVTVGEARRSWRRIVQRYSEPAPGPRPLMLPPDPAVLSGLGYYDLHPFGVEKRRAATLLRACSLARRLEEAARMAPEDARSRLMLVPGVGPWTAAEVTRMALGDTDAVSVGDLHLPHLVSWALAGEPRGDDERMIELLEPYRGQRARVLRLLQLSGVRPPRRGPRYNPIPIARL